MDVIKSIKDLSHEIDRLRFNLENLVPEIENEKDEELWDRTVELSSKMEGIKCDLENLSLDIKIKDSKINNLDEDLKIFLRNPYVSLDNIGVEMIGAAVFFGFALMMVSVVLETDLGSGAIWGYVAGAFGAGTGVYSYYRGAKKWRQGQWENYYQKYGKSNTPDSF